MERPRPILQREQRWGICLRGKQLQYSSKASVDHSCAATSDAARPQQSVGVAAHLWLHVWQTVAHARQTCMIGLLAARCCCCCQDGMHACMLPLPFVGGPACCATAAAAAAAAAAAELACVHALPLPMPAALRPVRDALTPLAANLFAAGGCPLAHTRHRFWVGGGWGGFIGCGCVGGWVADESMCSR